MERRGEVRRVKCGERTWRDQCSKFHFILLFKRNAVTITHEGSADVIRHTLRMLWLYSFILLTFTRGNAALESNEELRSQHTQTTEPDLQQIRSPLLEVFMHLPPDFHNVRSFRNALGVQPDRLKRKADPSSGTKGNRKPIVDVRNYEITQPAYLSDRNSTARSKREAESPQEAQTKAILEKPEPEKLISSLTGSVYRKDQSMLPVPDAIRGPMYTNYPVKEFDIVDIDDPDDPRRRRTDPSNGPEDNSQRDKRTFLEEGSGETTTSLPFWKRKKENPPFVTGRGGTVQNGDSYTPAQHRSGENARESHSLKNLDKTVQSNEISRSNQDNYYSSTNRRAYSRQYDSPPSSTPKSVYDTIDYNSKRNTDLGRNEGRNQDEKKETPREIRPQTHEQYINRQYTPPWMYDRPYYQPAYPYPTEVFGRGVEYYHRTYDPTTGRIIYYANMPEQARSYDYRFMDPINRSFYINRPYHFDPYYRNYVPPFDYRFANGFVRSGDYIRSGRSGSQAYSYPYQEREKFPRDARFIGGFETGNRPKDDFRNKTYIIYDAEESRSQFSRPQYVTENNRLPYTPAPGDNPSRSQVPFKQFPFPPPKDYFPPGAFPNRNNFYSAGPNPGWGFNHRTLPGVTESKSNSRPLHSPEVQLPLTTSNRREVETAKKS